METDVIEMGLIISRIAVVLDDKNFNLIKDDLALLQQKAQDIVKGNTNDRRGNKRSSRKGT